MRQIVRIAIVLAALSVCGSEEPTESSGPVTGDAYGLTEQKASHPLPESRPLRRWAGMRVAAGL
jgi:hypothetical protein